MQAEDIKSAHEESSVKPEPDVDDTDDEDLDALEAEAAAKAAAKREIQDIAQAVRYMIAFLLRMFESHFDELQTFSPCVRIVCIRMR